MPHGLTCPPTLIIMIKIIIKYNVLIIVIIELLLFLFDFDGSQGFITDNSFLRASSFHCALGPG